MTSLKPCCSSPQKPEPPNRTGLVALVVGIGAAILASLCCIGPLLAVIFGISGAVALVSLGKYHLYFLAGSAMLMIGAVLYIWRKQKCCASTGGKQKRFWAPFLVPFAVFGLSMLGVNQLLIPFLTANSSGFNNTTKPSASYLRHVTLSIDGMDCSGCTSTVQAALLRNSGVGHATVSFAKKEADVQFDPTKTDPKTLIEILANMQYKARLVKEGAVK